MAQKYKITESSKLPPGRSAAFEVEGRRIALFNVDGSFHAIDDVCPHADAPLSGGFVDPNQLTVSCPWHGAEFHLQTGKVLCPPARGDVTVYQVVQEGDDLHVLI